MSSNRRPQSDSSASVLLVEEAGPCGGCGGLLRSLGYSVRVAATGCEAVEAAARERFGAILLDLSLPGSDPFDVLITLGERSPVTPVVVLSGHLSLEQVLKAIALGAIDVWPKPITREPVASLIDRIREGRSTLAMLSSMPAPHLRDRSPDWPGKTDGEPTAPRPDGLGPHTLPSLRGLVNVLTNSSIPIDLFLGIAATLRTASEQCSAARMAPNVHFRSRSGALHGWRDMHHGNARRLLRCLNVHITAGRRPKEADVAAEMGMSAPHVGRVLTEVTGLGFRQWRMVFEMRLAVLMIATSREPVSQIGYRLGFEHPTQFSREFREFFGVPPGVFRILADAGVCAAAKSGE